MAANPVAAEPVAVGALATVLVYFAGRYGLALSPEQAAGAAGFVLTVVVPFVRQLVRPTSKETPLTAQLSGSFDHTHIPTPPATMTSWRTP
jgi:hypothetical protein